MKILGFSAGQAARQLARAGAGWGRATYGLSFARLLKNYESRAADDEASEDDRAYAEEKGKTDSERSRLDCGAGGISSRAGPRAKS